MFQLLKALWSTYQKPKFNFIDVHQHKQLVKPWHIDIYLHVNNAKYLEYYENARWQFSNQTGFSKILFDKKWKFIVVGAELSYIKELKVFQPFEIHTKICHHDDKYLYFEQRIISKNQLINHALFKVIILEGRKKIIPSEVINSIGITNFEKTNQLSIELWQQLIKSKQGLSFNP